MAVRRKTKKKRTVSRLRAKYRKGDCVSIDNRSHYLNLNRGRIVKTHGKGAFYTVSHGPAWPLRKYPSDKILGRTKGCARP